jgi:hypothetical protein
MKKPKKTKRKVSKEDAVDRLVVSQSEDDSAWGPRIRVKRTQETSLSIPGELAARAAFLAKAHREPGLSKWVERVLRERVELEELAFIEAKKGLAS